MANGSDVRMIDGQFDWQAGVNSAKVKTIASQTYPKGLARDQLVWLVNGTVRGGGITQRTGFQPLVQGAPWTGLYQGGILMEREFGDPYLVLAINGELWRVRVDTDNSVQNLSTIYGPGLTMPPAQPEAFFAQGELFVVWQAGDDTTNPIFFWDDGAALIGMRRSNGFVGVADPTNELPPALMMDYYQLRMWYGFQRNYVAGDIVTNKASGTAPFDYRDSILKVTENPVAKAGDAFTIPSTAGNIRALKHAANLDTALGESNLFVFTRKAVFACSVPITRDDWTKATLDLMPLQKVALIQGGSYSERGVVAVNGDLFFPSPPNGDIRSLTTALRYFNQWGNIPISRNENRILQFNDRSKLRYTSGIAFDNRLLLGSSPVQTPAGVASKTVLPLDFDIISTLEERTAPAWEGHQQGVLILQMFEGDFGGRPRAFAVVWNEVNLAVEIWEITMDSKFDNGDNRVEWVVEFPAYTWGDVLKLKKLVGGAIWIDKLFGTTQFTLQYRPNAYPCWINWHSWESCSARDCLEDIPTDCGYPSEAWCEGYEPDMEFPVPPSICISTRQKKPSNFGYQFQARLIIKGWCRVRGFILYAEPVMKPPWNNLIC